MKFRHCILLLASVLLACENEKNNPVEEKAKSTLLVYMAADNYLRNVAVSNIDSMKIGTGKNNSNLLVFIDRGYVAPCLLQIKNGATDTIKVYDDLNSADANTLAQIIEYVKDNYKTDSYGLVLWGHGMGWLPTKQLHYAAPNLYYAPERKSKSFAMENCIGGDHPYTCMELNDMANAIPDGLFDYIAFDACYMANVEIVYALRNKADYIISSCAEYSGDGYPYKKVTNDLMNGDLLKVCQEFYNYYNSKSGWDQMADISLVKTEGLDSLARCFKKIADEYKQDIQNVNVSDIQYFDRFSNHVFYDLADFVDKLGIRKELQAEFKSQLEKCVEYKISTPYIFPDSPEPIEINSYCGLSVFIPQQKYEEAGLNRDYASTEWSKNTNYTY